MPVTDDHGYVQFFVVNLVLSSFTTHQQIFNISVVHVAQSEVFWSIVRLFSFFLLLFEQITASDYCFGIFKLIFIDM